MPEFPGGVRNMNHFINSHLRYPVIAQENGTQGQVIAQFVIQADGTLSDLKIVKSVDPLGLTDHTKYSSQAIVFICPIRQSVVNSFRPIYFYPLRKGRPDYSPLSCRYQ